MTADDGFQDAIGNTLDALVRPRTPMPASEILRLADLYSDAGNLADAARDVGLEVVYTHQSGEIVDDISAHDLIPPFDLLAVNMPDGDWEETFGFVLRFLRVRRPVAFILADVEGDDMEAEFLASVQDKTQRLGYRVYGQRTFIVGVIWMEPFAWPSELTAQGVMAQVARDARANAGG